MSKIVSIWLNGLPGSGKTTLALALKKRLQEKYPKIKVLDGDEMRKTISIDLRFGENDRIEQIRRAAEINKLFLEEGYIVINAFISPLHKMRLLAKEIVSNTANVFEVALTTPIDICIKRDPKGLYKKAEEKIITGMTGIDSVFEPSETADIKIDTSTLTVDEAINLIIDKLSETGNL